MLAIQKSALFMRQWKLYARGYKERASVAVAERFVTAVEDALNFIALNPYACAPYDPGEGNDDLLVPEFRKWSLHHFPHLVLFRVNDKNDKFVIFVEALYAHKMDIPSRLLDDSE